MRENERQTDRNIQTDRQAQRAKARKHAVSSFKPPQIIRALHKLIPVKNSRKRRQCRQVKTPENGKHVINTSSVLSVNLDNAAKCLDETRTCPALPED